MEIARYLTLLMVMGLDAVFADGHKKKHHEHLKIHVPEFIHHDFHTKVITIHHHHHKPKKEHHHHHHHHHHKPKPVPHHVHKKKVVKTHTTTTKKTHGHKGHHGHHHHHKHHHHKHHGHHHKHHGHHHKHHGHHHKQHGHHHKHHGHHHHDPYSYDPTPVSYDPSPVSYDTSPESYDSAQGSFEDHFEPSYSPPTFDSGIPEDPRVHGFTHTVKQLQVFDSHQNDEGAPPSSASGYEVTEAGEDEDDPFHSENSLQHSYPGTVNFVKHLAAEEPSHDPFANLAVQSTIPSEAQFSPSQQPASNFGIETFSTAGAINQHEAQQYASAGPTQAAGLEHPSQEFSTGFEGDDDGGINDAETFSAPGASGIPSAYYTNDGHQATDEGPTSFSRTAGIQQSYHTGGEQTVVY